VLRISVAEVLLPTLTTWGRPGSQEVQDPVAEEGVKSFVGTIVLNAEL
jgi:hypothetical protein